MKRLCLLMALLLIGFSGCSEDEPQPKFEPAPSTSSTSTPPSTPPPTTEPPVKKLSPEETVEAWVKGLNHAYDTGDISLAEEVITSGCTTCQEFLKNAPGIYAAGGYVETEGWVIKGKPFHREREGSTEVIAPMLWSASINVFSKGEAPVKAPASKQIMYFQLERAGDSWDIAELGVIE